MYQSRSFLVEIQLCASRLFDLPHVSKVVIRQRRSRLWTWHCCRDIGEILPTPPRVCLLYAFTISPYHLFEPARSSASPTSTAESYTSIFWTLSTPALSPTMLFKTITATRIISPFHSSAHGEQQPSCDPIIHLGLEQWPYRVASLGAYNM